MSTYENNAYFRYELIKILKEIADILKLQNKQHKKCKERIAKLEKILKKEKETVECPYCKEKVTPERLYGCPKCRGVWKETEYFV